MKMLKLSPYFRICGFEFSKFVKSNIQSSPFFYIQIVNKFLICIYYWRLETRDDDWRRGVESCKHCGVWGVQNREWNWWESEKFLWFLEWNLLLIFMHLFISKFNSINWLRFPLISSLWHVKTCDVSPPHQRNHSNIDSTETQLTPKKVRIL